MTDVEKRTVTSTTTALLGTSPTKQPAASFSESFSSSSEAEEKKNNREDEEEEILAVQKRPEAAVAASTNPRNPKEQAQQHDRRMICEYPDRIQLSGELFEAVQNNRVFSDSKHYVDMLSTLLPSRVIEKWKEERDDPNFSLSKFISENFELPEVLTENENDDENASTTTTKNNTTTRQHVKELWPKLFRKADDDSIPHSSLIPLPFPYVVPGGRFREIYYWDSYFTIHGLLADGRKDMAYNMAKNFQHLIQTCGHVPNGNRYYYLSRSQPPFFSAMISLLIAEHRDDDHNKQQPLNIMEEFYEEVLKEHSFWMDKDTTSNAFANDGGDRRCVTFMDRKGQKTHTLNRYWDDNPIPREESWIEDKMEFEKSAYHDDPEAFYRHVRAACESGWDFSSRWLADKTNLATIETTRIIPVDLNVILWFVETKIAEWSESLGHVSRAEEFGQRAARRKESIDELCWDDKEGFYFDYHLDKGGRTNCYSLAAIYPLYFNMSTQSQAEAVANRLEKEFLKDGGLITTTTTTSQQQWDAPNGWAPLQWMAVYGLEHYGLLQLAEQIRGRWLKLNDQVYEETGKMVEKYNVVNLEEKGGGGEYPLQDGFGWTNGVYSAMSARLDQRLHEHEAL